MKIDILCVGKIKEKYFTDALNEYAKRLSKFAQVNIIEVKDEMTPDGASEKEESLIKNKEGAKLLTHIKSSAYLVALCIEGTQISSEKLASNITEIQNSGYSHIQFVIGGSLGICDEIKEKAKYKLSFSKMTFPHQLMRVVLLEQIYRAFKINNNEPYHK